MKTDLGPLRERLATHEDWLMERVLRYAHERDYTRYTSTLAEAWRISVRGLSDAIIQACKQYDAPPELGPDEDYTLDPIAAFGILEAQKHRDRGITVAMFLGLLKYYKQSYLDCIQEAEFDADTMRVYLLFLERSFDRVELGFCSEWTSLSETDRIHDLQKMNRRMTNEKNRYLTIFESLHDPAIFADEDNRVVNMNHAALEMFGISGDPGSAYYDEHIPDDLRVWLPGELAQLTDTGQSERSYEKAVWVGDSIRHFNIKLKRMLDVSDKFTGAIILLDDITARKQAEAKLESTAGELKRSNSELERFAYVVSHDLQEPLRKITAFGDLLDKHSTDQLDETGRDYVSRMINASQRMGELIQSLLTYARVTTRKDPPQQVALASILGEVLSDLEVAVEESDARVEVGELPTVLAEPVKLRQLMQNLIGNALKFRRPEVAPRIEVRAEPLKSGEAGGDRKHLRLLVEDNGIGFDMKYAERVFGVFQRLHRRGEYEGTGIGLAVCSRIVQQLGGEISVHSSPGEGTTFKIDLPADLIVTRGEADAETAEVAPA